MAVQPIEEIVQAVRQSAYRCTCCSFRAGIRLLSIVKPTISYVGSFETARNNETVDTPTLHFFLEKRPPSPEMTPFPTLPGRKLACPRGRRLRNGLP